MTKEIRTKIEKIVSENMYTPIGAAMKICDLVDQYVAEALKESSTMGELLDAVGLHIVPKERTDE